MRIWFNVNLAAAFAAGKNAQSTLTSVDVDPSQLSQEDREAIGSALYTEEHREGAVCGTPGLGYSGQFVHKRPITADGNTVNDLLEAIRKEHASIRERIAEGEARKAKDHAKTVELVELGKTCDCVKWVNAEGVKWGNDSSAEPRARVITLVPDLFYGHDSEYMKSPPALKWLGELKAYNDKALADGAERARMMARQWKEKALAKAAEDQWKREAEEKLEREKTEYRDRWVKFNCDPDDKERWKEGLMPAEEVDSLIENLTFLPYCDFARYEPIKFGEVCDCDDDCEVTFEIEENTPLTRESYARLKKLRAVSKENEVVPRKHSASADAHNTIERHGAIVIINAGPFVLSREYAI